MGKRTCSLARCEKTHEAKGLCRTHYARWLREGDRALRWDGHKPTIVRFRDNVRPTPRWACWEWQGSLNDNGYGRIRHDGREMYVHRFAHEWFLGPIPEGLEVDHVCNVRHCVNPEHLQVTTHERNVQLIFERSTTCRNGKHPKPSGPRCLDCQREAARRRASAQHQNAG